MIGHEDLMRYIDDELPPERRREVEAALETSTELKRNYVIFSRMKTDLQAIGARMGEHGSAWTGVNRRLTRPVGWILFLVGALVWLGYGIYHYLTGSDAMWEKLATAAVVVGLGILLLSVVVERLRDLKSDPYREIQR